MMHSKKITILIIAPYLLCLFLLGWFDSWLNLESDLTLWLFIICQIVFSYAWYLVDSKKYNDFRTGKVAMLLGFVLFLIFAIAYYLYRTRKLKLALCHFVYVIAVFILGNITYDIGFWSADKVNNYRSYHAIVHGIANADTSNERIAQVINEYASIIDEKKTPHIYIDTSNIKSPWVDELRHHIQSNALVFNISPEAIDKFSWQDDVMVFNAMFDGVSTTLEIPINSVMSIYAIEDTQLSRKQN